MQNAKRKTGPDTDLRSFLKNQHKKVYSICRFFATNYKEHQRLFIDIIAAASQNIRFAKGGSERDTLLLRACINMSALHSIRLDLAPPTDREIHFKSPDFQRNMTQFRDVVGATSDLDKFRLFLGLEKVAPDEMADLIGLTTSGLVVANGPAMLRKESPKKNFLPYLKEKLIWN